MFILIKKSCVESVLTWNKPVHMEMKAFQRGGASCTSVNRKFNAAFLQCVDLCVESKTRGILDARYILTLYLPDLLDLLTVKKRHSLGIKTSGAIYGF